MCSSARTADARGLYVAAAAIEEALRASPADPLARARHGLMSLEEDKHIPNLRERADHESLFATMLSPDQARVWQARAKVLATLRRAPEACAATRQATAPAGIGEQLFSKSCLGRPALRTNRPHGWTGKLTHAVL
jgi:hypothetical protein